jgi:hypothetical protein
MLEMLAGAQYSLLSDGGPSILWNLAKFKTGVYLPGRSFADNAGAKGDLSDNINAAAELC